jgi:hypothetical protein
MITPQELKKRIRTKYGSIKDMQERVYPKMDLNGIRVGIRKPARTWLVNAWYKLEVISADELKETLEFLDEEII